MSLFAVLQVKQQVTQFSIVCDFELSIMGDPQRFDALASFIEARVSDKSVKIADVAAGKGQLSLALKRRGYKHITAFEPCPRQKLKGAIQLKTCQFTNGDCFDIIIGMHPDQATDVILDEACKSSTRRPDAKRSAVILVPCCALPNRWKFTVLEHRKLCFSGKKTMPNVPPNRQDDNYYRWLNHLVLESKSRGLMLKRAELPISGRNIVLYGRC